jgi:zinc-ribbon domain
VAVSITCSGCGQRLTISGDPKRRKVQCPECGVFSEVPAEKRGKRASAKEPLPGPRAQPSTPAADDAAVELAVDIWSDSYGPPRAIPQSSPTSAEPEIVHSDADDGRPYQVAGGDERKCPDCGRVLLKDATLCPHCGFNCETGKKAVRVYELLALHWDAGLSFRRRLRWFVIGECAALALALMGALVADHPGESVTSLLLFTLLLAFLLGTFDRLELTRNKRGRVVLTQTWRVLFIARPTTTIPLREYEGIVINLAHDVGVLDWIVLGVLLLFGIIPGLIWWFWAMQQDTYEVALTKNHGYPERILYRGWSQSQAREIAKILHEVSGFAA